MSFIDRHKIKKLLLTVVWILIGCSSAILLVAAVKKNEKGKCTGIQIEIEGVNNHYFIDKKDVEQIIYRYGGNSPQGKPIELFDLKRMESALKNDIWIKNAQMFFDNNGVLQVNIEEREPVARVFTAGGSSFYIDSSQMMLPLSEKFSARLPVFTGFPSEAKVLKRSDSTLLSDIKSIAMSIQEDPFLMGMIDQVDITSNRLFEIIPMVGDQVIVFGDADNYEEKFNNLKLFYKKVIVNTGWSYYSVINLQYKGQVVGKIRSADDVAADSLRTVELMTLIAAEAKLKAADSIKTFLQDSEKNTADSSMIMQSIQREEDVHEPVFKEQGNEVHEEIKTVSVIAGVKTKPVVAKPAVKKAEVTKPVVRSEGVKKMGRDKNEIKKPKAVMAPPIRNDY